MHLECGERHEEVGRDACESEVAFEQLDEAEVGVLHLGDHLLDGERVEVDGWAHLE